MKALMAHVQSLQFEQVGGGVSYGWISADGKTIIHQVKQTALADLVAELVRGVGVLSPTYRGYSLFAQVAKFSDWSDPAIPAGHALLKHVDGKVKFWGNFDNVSTPFNVYTSDVFIIEHLTDLILKNLSSQGYAMAEQRPYHKQDGVFTYYKHGEGVDGVRSSGRVNKNPIPDHWVKIGTSEDMTTAAAFEVARGVLLDRFKC